MSITAAIRKMLDKGLTIEQALIAAEAFESEPPALTVRQARNKRYYNSHKRLNPSEQDAQDDKVPPKKEITPTPPKEKTTPSKSLSVSAREFAEFWSLFPNKVGKRDAERAFANARTRAPLEAILDGLRRYATKRDDRPWCNPATFLNQNRWEDEPAATAPRPHSTASPPLGKRMNAVEANLARRQQKNGSESGRRDNGDAELLSPNEPGLPDFIRDTGKALTWRG